jgi:hypothetical protein
MEGRLLGLVTISNQSTDHVDQEIDGTTMTRMLDLRDILKLVNNRFNNRTLTALQSITQQRFLPSRFKALAKVIDVAKEFF